MDTVFKLVSNFLHWGEPRFRTKAETIVTAMTTEPMVTLLPDPLPTTVPTRAAGLLALADYKAAAQLANDGDRAAIAARNEKRAILEEALTDWVPVLELAAKNAGSLAILENSGYDLRQPNQPVPQPPPAPLLEVRHGRVSRLLIGKITGRPKGVALFETQRCTSDPTVEANWNSTVQTTGCRSIRLADCTPGELYYIRTCAIGRGGPSNWSNVANIIAI